jgi:SAM-dependent methyltransferase
MIDRSRAPRGDGTPPGPVNDAPPHRYDCDRARLPASLAGAFVTLAPDDATRAFLARAPHGRAATFARRVLGAVLSDYDANALLDFYPLHLLSTAQWRALLGPTARGALLDVGAGAGDVTAQLAPLFEAVTATETSRGMARRLRARGYACHALDLAESALPGDAAARFDVVALLNVLDRAPRPLTLLERARALVAPGGRLVVAVPLPLSPHVHVAGGTVDPEELLPMDDATEWEPAVASLVDRVFAPLALHVERLTRTPYLSRGDAETPRYALDDALFVLRADP